MADKSKLTTTNNETDNNNNNNNISKNRIWNNYNVDGVVTKGGDCDDDDDDLRNSKRDNSHRQVCRYVLASLYPL